MSQKILLESSTPSIFPTHGRENSYCQKDGKQSNGTFDNGLIGTAVEMEDGDYFMVQSCLFVCGVIF